MRVQEAPGIEAPGISGVADVDVLILVIEPQKALAHLKGSTDECSVFGKACVGIPRSFEPQGAGKFERAAHHIGVFRTIRCMFAVPDLPSS
jgi:hypothetical protein